MLQDGGDWWRAASEQTSRQATTDSVGPGAFYAGITICPIDRPFLLTVISAFRFASNQVCLFLIWSCSFSLFFFGTNSDFSLYSHWWILSQLFLKNQELTNKRFNGNTCLKSLVKICVMDFHDILSFY